MRQIRLTFPSGELSLDGVAHIPDGDSPFPGVVVCHPHPLFGGDMDNNVVLAVSYALCQLSIVALRFNFRGVDGAEEDVKAAISCISSMDEVEPERIGLCGYSFGAGVSLSIAPDEERIKALALISPPPMEGLRSPEACRVPKLIIAGSRDMFVPMGWLKELVEGLSQPIEYEVIEGADHFWWGYEDRLARRASDFFCRILNP